MKIRSLAASVAVISLASAAHAADIAPITSAPAAIAPTAYDWSGAYVGVFGGLTTGDFDYEASDGIDTIDAEVSGSGFLGGVQGGYDWQSGSWVFGAIADIAFTNHEASISASIGPDTIDAESQLKYLGTVRARVGHAWDRALVYGHGGFAYGRTEQDVSISGTTLFEDEQSRTGWTVGAGVEYAVTDRISFGTEYSYVDLGSEEVFSGGGVTVEEDLQFHAIKAMLNFRF